MPNTEGTTKKGAATSEVPLESASPTGHEEIESQIVAEQMAEGDGAAPAAGGGEGPMAQTVTAKGPTDEDTDKPTVTGTETNPKHSDSEPSTPSKREGP
ncbi:hypothetical protein EON81_09185 [bacterium]|nr:MAG: hypothetical protein EON81_09185 [bacterium]